MQKVVFFISIITLSLILNSCTENKQSSKIPHSTTDSTLTITHAKGFSISYHKDYKTVTIHSPWQKNNPLAVYYLVNDPSTETPDKNATFTIPLTNIATSSATHIEFLAQLNQLNTIKGVCTPQLIYNKQVTKLLDQNKISNIGDAFNINIERLMHLVPDAIMLSAYNQQDETARRLSQASIPVIFNNEWTESTPLARAEWIKFVAAFFNMETTADSIFSNIEAEYIKYSSITDSITHKPSIIVGGNFKGTWYIPGGQSYMGKLFTDAGANYLYANDTTEQSIPLNFETILLQFQHADVWLNAPAKSLSELHAIDEKHNLFSAAKNKQVYGFYNRINSTGANDFWESAVCNPDIVLCDIIWALHPHLLPNYTPTYITHLK